MKNNKSKTKTKKAAAAGCCKTAAKRCGRTRGNECAVSIEDLVGKIVATAVSMVLSKQDDGSRQNRKMSRGEELMWDFIREEEAKKRQGAHSGARSAGDFIVSYLTDHSKYDLSGLEIGYRPSAVSPDSAVDVYLGERIESDGATQVVTEIFTVPLYEDDPDGSVEAFDAGVDSLVYIKPAMKCEKSEITGKACGECKCREEKAVETPFAALTTRKDLDGFKRFLLNGSKYEIPSTRFQVLFDKADRKSQKFVYELRFFQKGGYRKDETASYERALLRVKMKGDCEAAIVKRFDKAVSELRFNEFADKQEVR